MKKIHTTRISLFLLLFFGGSYAVASPVIAASSESKSVKAQGEPKKQGYTSFATKDEILAGAKKEGSLRAMSQFDPRTNKAWVAAFKKRYPFIDVQMADATGTDPPAAIASRTKSRETNGLGCLRHSS